MTPTPLDDAANLLGRCRPGCSPDVRRTVRGQNADTPPDNARQLAGRPSGSTSRRTPRRRSDDNKPNHQNDHEHID